MQLIVNIPEETYNAVIDDEWIDSEYIYNIIKSIQNGTLLPKGHGRLGDLDIILNKAMKHRESYMETENSSYCRGKLHAYELYVEEVENAPTIIEADKGEQNENK